MRRQAIIGALLAAGGLAASAPCGIGPGAGGRPPRARARPADADHDRPARPAGDQGESPGPRDRLDRRLRGRGHPGRARGPGRDPLGRHHHQAGRQVGARGGAAEDDDVHAHESLPGSPAHRAGRPAGAQRHGGGGVPPGQGPADRLGRDRGRARHGVRSGRGRAVQLRVPGPRRADAAAASPVGDFMDRFEIAGPHWQFFGGSPLGRLELAPLNPDLGQYFGTDEGVLVISAPKDSALGPPGRRRGPGGGRPGARRARPT